MLYYKRRRYSCSCGKRFSEKTSFIDRYQRFSKDWNQVIQILVVKSPTFKSVAEKMGTSISTVIRRFDKVAEKQLTSGVTLPKIIAIDEYKGDTNAGKFQLVIADAETHEPIDILSNRRKDTIKQYLQKYGDQVEIVVMDMNQSFKAAVKEAYCEWFDWAKTSTDMIEIKERLSLFYRKVIEHDILAFNQVMKTMKNWQTEILNSFAFGYSNGFL